MAERLALYSRTSTADQNLDVQTLQLREYAARRWAEVVEFTDQGHSGRKSRRPGLTAMMKAVRRGEVDTVAVVRLDRLARSLAHMAALGEELRELRVDLVSLTEGVDSSTSSGRAMLGMCGVFAQLEADLIRERTVAGLAAARRRGKKLGRPQVLDRRARARVRRLRRAGHSLRAIGRLLGVAPSTVAKELATK